MYLCMCISRVVTCGRKPGKDLQDIRYLCEPQQAKGQNIVLYTRYTIARRYISRDAGFPSTWPSWMSVDDVTQHSRPAKYSYM